MKFIRWALLTSLLLAAPAWADNAVKPALAKKPTPEATPAPASAPVSSEPESTTANFGDWSLHCTHVQAAAKPMRICEVLQSISVQGETHPIAQIAFGRLNPEDALKVTAALPNNISLPSTVKIAVDDKDTLVAELSWRRCLPGGCFADVEPQDDLIAHWRAQTDKGRLTFRDGAGRDLPLPFSFRGLAQALDALAKG